MIIKKIFAILFTIISIILPQRHIQVAKTTSLDMQEKCPQGFVLVNGNPLYKTNDFCVMKYDAKSSNPDPRCITKEEVYKNNSQGCQASQIVSTPEGAPIAFIPEDDGTKVSAKAYCERAGWHLITNPEWMTIARNVEKVPDNWCNKDGTGCGNTPGTPGKILANGHNDNIPSKALIAGSDSEPCFGTASDGSNKCGEKGSQKRTLTLENGEIIWDFAGNVWQWVDAGIQRKDEPRSKIPGLGGDAWVWAEFQTVPYDINFSPSDPNWDSRSGVGRIFHYNSGGDKDTTIYTFIRGGNWRHRYDSGAFTIHMQPVPGKTNIDDIGFRCVANIDRGNNKE